MKKKKTLNKHQKNINKKKAEIAEIDKSIDNKKDNIIIYKIVFGLLLLLVIILSVLAYKTSKENPKTNYTVPIAKGNNEVTLEVDTTSLKKNNKKEYTFSIVNYNNKNQIDGNNTKYIIEIIPSSNIETSNKLTKLDSTKNLLINNKTNYRKFKNSSKKSKDNYKLTIKMKNKKDKKNSYVTIYVKGIVK